MTLTPAQKRLANSLNSGWLERPTNGVYYYRSPGYKVKSLNEKTALAVLSELPMVKLLCKSPIKGIVQTILIREDRKHLLDGQYVIVREI